MLIRRAELKDISALNRFRKMSFVFHKKFDKEFFKFEPDSGFFRRAIHSSKKIVLVAENDGILLGFCYGIVKGKEGHLVNLFVSEKNRRKGIGKSLIKQMLFEFKRKKIKVVLTSIWHSNDLSINLHKKLGFKSTHLWMKKSI